jgi:diacylglycerol kinase (ATP)
MPPAVAIILNGISRKKKKFYRDLYPSLARKFSMEIFETQWAGHAVALAAQATKDGIPVILAAGGDGTLHQVINGVRQNTSNPPPVVGLIPLGTGNDFARTCGLYPDAIQLSSLLERNQPKPVDLGKLTCRDSQGNTATRFFVNACSIGMGPAVVQRLAKSNRTLGPTLTYWKAITATFLTHRPQEITAQAGEWQWKGKIRVLAVANGRSFGNALFIAPDARVDDGHLDLFIAGELRLWKFLLYQQALKTPKKIQDDHIHYHPLPAIALRSNGVCPIETEGELAGYLPADIEVIPRAIQFLR